MRYFVIFITALSLICFVINGMLIWHHVDIISNAWLWAITIASFIQFFLCGYISFNYLAFQTASKLRDELSESIEKNRELKDMIHAIGMHEAVNLYKAFKAKEKAKTT
jgi:hypothetical protein